MYILALFENIETDLIDHTIGSRRIRLIVSFHIRTDIDVQFTNANRNFIRDLLHTERRFAAVRC